MNDKKIKLLLNKVVEYNNPKGRNGTRLHFKGFLYKNENKSGYYFKLIEIIEGNYNFDSLIQLIEGDENFLVIAEKPKLMVVSKKSWHYSLVKHVLKDKTPTPKDMQNGCPYFWLLIFSVIVVPFVELYKVLNFIVMLIPKLIVWVIEEIINVWLTSMSDAEAYSYQHNYNSNHTSETPKIVKFILKKSKHDNLFDYFMSKKYDGITADVYEDKRQTIKEEWKEWDNEIGERKKVLSVKKDDKYCADQKKKGEYNRKRRAREARWEARIRPFGDFLTNTSRSIRKTFTFERGKYSDVIKLTKKFVGAIVSVIVLIATYYIVNLLSLGIMLLIDIIIVQWLTIIMAIGIIGVAVGLYFVGVAIHTWGQNKVNQYKQGKEIWFVELFKYVIWYPIKWIGLGFMYIVWHPIRFMFYTILFIGILKPTGLFIAAMSVSLFKGIVGSTGIFGEYFGASYSDYCPGIEWKDFDKE